MEPRMNADKRRYFLLEVIGVVLSCLRLMTGVYKRGNFNNVIGAPSIKYSFIRVHLRSSAVKIASLILLASLTITACDQIIPMPDPRGNMPEGGPPPVPGAGADYAAFVVTTDYSISSGFAVIDLDTRVAYHPDPAFAAQVVSPDPTAIAYDDYIFIINRYTYDNVTVLDQSFNLVNQYSVADPACPLPNPQDLAFQSIDKAYLSRYGCTDLWIINPLTGQKLGAIDVPPEFIDADGIPEMSGLLLHGATLYVAIQKLARNAGGQMTWPPTDDSRLLLVDTAVDAVFADIVLTGKNPIAGPVYNPDLGRILVGCVGSYFSFDVDGGVEAIDPAAMISEGYLIDEISMGGQLGDFAIASPGRGYVTITDQFTWQSALYGFDPQTGTRDPAPIYSSPVDFAMWDIELNDRGELFICDRRATDPGIAIIDTLNNDALLTPSRISTFLPPFSLAFLR